MEQRFEICGETYTLDDLADSLVCMIGTPPVADWEIRRGVYEFMEDYGMDDEFEVMPILERALEMLAKQEADAAEEAREDAIWMANNPDWENY